MFAVKSVSVVNEGSTYFYVLLYDIKHNSNNLLMIVANKLLNATADIFRGVKCCHAEKSQK